MWSTKTAYANVLTSPEAAALLSVLSAFVLVLSVFVLDCSVCLVVMRFSQVLHILLQLRKRRLCGIHIAALKGLAQSVIIALNGALRIGIRGRVLC